MQEFNNTHDKTISIKESSDLLLQNRLLEEMLDNNQIINIDDFRHLITSLDEKALSK